MAEKWALSKFEAGARWEGQILSPFSGHDSLTILIRNLWTAHVYLYELRWSFSPVASAGDRSQLMTLRLPAHAACPQHDCTLFVCYLKLLYATCDIVRGLWLLSEGSAMPDRRWNDNGGLVGQFSNTSSRWVSLRCVSRVLRRSVCFRSCLARCRTEHCSCRWRF